MIRAACTAFCIAFGAVLGFVAGAIVLTLGAAVLDDIGRRKR